MILTTILLFVISLLIFLCAILGIKVVVMKNDMAELYLRVALTEQKIKFQLDNSKPIEQSEGFLRFISESRDSAFQYIEEVQSVLNKFINDIEPEINYFKEYGDLISMAPNYYSMKKIAECYNDLKVLLPEDYGKIDK